MTLEDGTNRLSRNVGNNYQSALHKIPEQGTSLAHLSLTRRVYYHPNFSLHVTLNNYQVGEHLTAITSVDPIK